MTMKESRDITVTIPAEPHVEEDVTSMDTIVVKVGIHDGAAAEAESPTKSSNIRRQRYRSSWEEVDELKDWLEPVKIDPYMAWCRRCQCGLTCHLKNLYAHAKSTKHLKGGGKRGRPSSTPGVPRKRKAMRRRKPKLALPETLPPPEVGGGTPEPPPSPLAERPEGETGGQRVDVSYSDTGRMNLSIGLHNQTVGVIGAGCIAQAAVKGMMEKGVISPGSVLVSAPSSRNSETWRRWGCSFTRDTAEVVRSADVLLVAVPPQVAGPVFHSLGAALTGDRERCFLSLVSGWPRHKIIQTINSGLRESGVRRPEDSQKPLQDCQEPPQDSQKTSDSTPEGTQGTPEGTVTPAGGQEPAFHVVRCVPNLPLAIGEGNTVYCCADDLSDRWLLAVETVFSALGICRKVPEYLADVYSGAFSSGTAFVLSFIDALASGAVNLGVPWYEALQMAAITTSGAARLVLDSGRAPSELRRDASAAGSSTLAGTMALQKAGLEYAVMSAVQAASERCTQLGECRPPAD